MGCPADDLPPCLEGSLSVLSYMMPSCGCGPDDECGWGAIAVLQCPPGLHRETSSRNVHGYLGTPARPERVAH